MQMSYISVVKLCVHCVHCSIGWLYMYVYCEKTEVTAYTFKRLYNLMKALNCNYLLKSSGFW